MLKNAYLDILGVGNAEFADSSVDHSIWLILENGMVCQIPNGQVWD